MRYRSKQGREFIWIIEKINGTSKNYGQVSLVFVGSFKVINLILYFYLDDLREFALKLRVWIFSYVSLEVWTRTFSKIVWLCDYP